jgi:terminal uridylyltransferase
MKKAITSINFYCRYVIAITGAKVPIVKFTDLKTEIEGDISLYNTLAQENTRMLLTYSNIDIRVKV